jgi:hypothetical protein
LFGLFVDDGWLAAGVLIWTMGAWVVAARYSIASAGACLFFAVGPLLLLSASALRQARG